MCMSAVLYESICVAWEGSNHTPRCCCLTFVPFFQTSGQEPRPSDFAHRKKKKKKRRRKKQKQEKLAEQMKEKGKGGGNKGGKKVGNTKRKGEKEKEGRKEGRKEAVVCGGAACVGSCATLQIERFVKFDQCHHQLSDTVLQIGHHTGLGAASWVCLCTLRASEEADKKEEGGRGGEGGGRELGAWDS